MEVLRRRRPGWIMRPSRWAASDVDIHMRDEVIRLVGVYDADSSFRGELTYFVGARLGRRHCALCDITHGVVRQRAQWRACKTGLPVPFDTFHRDDQPADIRVATHDATPVVVAQTAGAYELLLSPAQLEACEGRPDRLVAAIERAVDERGYAWGSAV